MAVLRRPGGGRPGCAGRRGSANRRRVPPGAQGPRAARRRARLHRPAPGRSRRCRPTSRSALDYEEGRTLIDEACRVERPGPARGAAEGRAGQARGIRQGPCPASRGPRCPGAAGQAAGGARLPGDAPGRGHPGQGEEGRQARRGPRRVHPGARGLRQGGRWRWPRLQGQFPVSMPENDPRRAERDAVYASYLDAHAPEGRLPTTSWPRPIRRRPPSGPST